VFPFGGGDTFDASRCSPDTCGTYELAPGTLAVRWDGGRTDRWPFAIAADAMTLDGQTFRPARAVAATALVGQWSSGQSAGGVGSNVYEFQSDGTFAFGSGATRLGGRYRVQGLTLTLEFTDGDRRVRTLFAAGAAAPLALIGVDNEVYARR